MVDLKVKCTVVVVSLITILCSIEVSGSQYTPEGLYDPEYFTLANGLDVVLKQRTVTHNAAIRLSVKVGQYDFECGRQEVPHFLEHLLFTGTSQHSETELDALIEENGGSWNAGTGSERTDYEIDIYSQNVLLALDVLHEIITDSQITEENVERSRDIIHREAEGKPSRLRQVLYRRGIGRSAVDNALLTMFPDSNIQCPALETADKINRNDILEVLEKYYVPTNMLLAIVGEYDRDALMERINATFGTLKGKSLERNPLKIPGYFRSGPAEVSGTLSPLLDSDANAGLAFRTEGYLSRDFHVLNVIEWYLYNRLYNSLRVEKGLSYSPSTDYIPDTGFGAFVLTADVEVDDIDRALEQFQYEIDILKSGRTERDEIEKTKKKILLSLVQGYESNSDIADYYVTKHHEFIHFGKLINHEDRIEHITADDIQTVSARYFTDERSIILKSTPTLTYTQFYILIIAVLILLLLVIIHYARKIRRQRAAV